MPLSWVPWLIITYGALWNERIFVISSRSRLAYSAESLQGEIEDYLKTLSEQQPVYQAPSIPHVLENIPPYPSLRLSQFAPPAGSLPNPSSLTDSKVSSHIWPRFQHSNPEERAFASASVHVKRPETSETIKINTNAVVFSPLQDVENEEYINEEHQGSTSKEPPQPIQQTRTVSEAMARKSSALTTLNENSEVSKASENFSDVYFVAIVAGCCAAGIFGVISAGFCFYRLQKHSKAAAEVDYPAYGVTGPSKDSTPPNGDRKLAQSAQMYHYQHQKQQMIAVEKAGSTKNTSASDVDTEEENEEGEYTVYECPGLAPTGEMEVKNPLFNDDSTPMSPPVSAIKPDEIHTK